MVLTNQNKCERLQFSNPNSCERARQQTRRPLRSLHCFTTDVVKCNGAHDPIRCLHFVPGENLIGPKILTSLVSSEIFPALSTNLCSAMLFLLDRTCCVPVFDGLPLLCWWILSFFSNYMHCVLVPRFFLR